MQGSLVEAEEEVEDEELNNHTLLFNSNGEF